MNESVLSMLSDRLAGGGQVLCAWVTMNEPAVAEALAREVFDAVVLDMQHGACRQTDDRSRADRRIRRGCATLGRVRQIPAARQRSWGPRADCRMTSRSSLLWELRSKRGGVHYRMAQRTREPTSTCIFWESAVSSGNVSV
jgi:hypothetical protein